MRIAASVVLTMLAAAKTTTTTSASLSFSLRDETSKLRRSKRNEERLTQVRRAQHIPTRGVRNFPRSRLPLRVVCYLGRDRNSTRKKDTGKRERDQFKSEAPVFLPPRGVLLNATTKRGCFLETHPSHPSSRPKIRTR